jgi:fucose permease
MSSFHALFSVGGLAGAGLAAGLVGFGDPASAWSAFGVLLLFALAALLVRQWYRPDTSHRAGGARFTLPSRPLIALGILAFLAFGLEGAVADWSALFLEDEKKATPALAAAGYAAFSGAMAVMRFLGDGIVARTGRQRALMLSGAVIAGGCALALVAPWPIVSAVGFGIMGIGAANVVPILLSTAATFPPGSGRVSAVATIGYLGALIWPPAIGGIAHSVGLPVALWLIVAAGVVIAVRAGIVPRSG